MHQTDTPIGHNGQELGAICCHPHVNDDGGDVLHVVVQHPSSVSHGSASVDKRSHADVPVPIIEVAVGVEPVPMNRELHKCVGIMYVQTRDITYIIRIPDILSHRREHV